MCGSDKIETHDGIKLIFLLAFPELVEIAVSIHCFYLISLAYREAGIRLVTGLKHLALIAKLCFKCNPLNVMGSLSLIHI